MSKKNSTTVKQVGGSQQRYLTHMKTKRNKINKSLHRINYKKRSIEIKFFPSINVHSDVFSGTEINRFSSKKRGVKKLNCDFSFSRLSSNENLISRKYSKIQKMEKNVIQIFALDENLTTCYFSMGSLVNLKYDNMVKTVIITHWEKFDTVGDFNFYACNSKDAQFLKFFEGLNHPNLEVRQKYFLYGLKRGLKNIDVDPLFLKNVKNKEEKNHMLILSPPYENMNELHFCDLPIVDLNSNKKFKMGGEIKKNKNKNLKEQILFFSLPLDYDSGLEIDGKENFNNFLKEGVRNYNKLSLSFGKINLNDTHENREDPYLEFKTTVEYGGVGSLVYRTHNLTTPLGMNIGICGDKNLILNFNSQLTKEILINYMQESRQSCFTFN